ncbi:TolC family protein [Novosphingobium sp. Fuku2-ISO-50]|uniref:TolC family protein n=1 Tax=Novosphingobium sp. Fuku2-ISO-50 TaxID=1739114 RepID=UPI00076DA6A2|nr:TolC family protein [Novosphingobium sp. Fuku2-ISO-50]KUR76734.1 type I secretion protein TolC [Novosphingobium sp. Fuku2-ISO-50]
MRCWCLARLRPLAPLPFLLLAHSASAQDLTTAISDALGHAPALAEAQSDEALASAKLDAARAEGHPLVSVQGQVGAGRIDNGGFFGFTAQNVTPLAVQAGAEMPLYAGGRVAAAIDQAHGGVDMARLGLADARARTIVSAVAAYAEVLTARRIEARFRHLTSELTEVERQAGLRFKTGEIPASELAAATARRAEGDAGLAGAEGRRISAEAQFRRLTGHDAGALAPLPALPATPPTLDEAVDSAHQANPALAQAEKGIDIARAGVRAAKAESLPTIGAFAEATRTRDQFFPGYQADAFAVGIRGHWTLWAGGRTNAKIHEADATLDGSEARARDARDSVDSAVITAWTGLATAGHMVAATAARSAAAAEALRSTQLEAKVGAKPTLAVLDAEREAMAAEAAMIEAEGQRLIAAWQLNALTGALSP